MRKQFFSRFSFFFVRVVQREAHAIKQKITPFIASNIPHIFCMSMTISFGIVRIHFEPFLAFIPCTRVVSLFLPHILRRRWVLRMLSMPWRVFFLFFRRATIVKCKMMFRPFGGYADRRMAGMQISEKKAASKRGQIKF